MTTTDIPFALVGLLIRTESTIIMEVLVVLLQTGGGGGGGGGGLPVQSRVEGTGA